MQTALIFSHRKLIPRISTWGDTQIRGENFPGLTIWFYIKILYLSIYFC